MFALIILILLILAGVYVALHPVVLAVLALVVFLLIYTAAHRHHYRRHRRAGLTVRESIPGPFGTWWSVGKRFRN